MTSVTAASLNVRGVPVVGSHLAERCAAIGEAFETSEVAVVNFQEVHTYYHLRQLTRHMPSFRFVSYQQSVVGPAGGVVTLSRLPVASTEYRRFPSPPAVALEGLPRLTRVRVLLKGTLLTRLAAPRVWVVNTHLLANVDGDWSESSRFYRVQQDELAALGQVVGSLSDPAVLSGDFNVARDSRLFDDFMSDTKLVDAFGNQCPATFHAEYLSPGKAPRCTDFLLLAGSSIKIESAELMFTAKVPMTIGPEYVSDHLGLRAKVVVSA